MAEATRLKMWCRGHLEWQYLSTKWQRSQGNWSCSKTFGSVSCYNSRATIVSCDSVCDFQFKRMPFSTGSYFPVVWNRFHTNSFLCVWPAIFTVSGVHKSVFQAWELEDSPEISHRGEALLLPVFRLHESVQQQLGPRQASADTRGHGEYVASRSGLSTISVLSQIVLNTAS
jgi:hypothetical protein